LVCGQETSSPTNTQTNLAPRRTALKMKRSLSSLIQCWIAHGVYGTINVLETIETVNIAEEMLIGTNETGLPEPLQGLWWMEGNRAPEVVTSLGGSIWDADSRTIVVNPTFDEGVWAYNDDLLGKLLYGLIQVPTLASNVLQFNEDLTYADILLTVRVLGCTVRLPRWFLSFSMFFVEDGLWDRGSYTFLGVLVTDSQRYGYNLRRIVTADGEPTDSFSDFVANTPDTLRVPRRPH